MKDLTGYTLTFSDEFNTRSISQNGAGTVWADIRPEWRFDAQSDIGFGRSSFVDPGSGYDPFKVENGILTITAVPDRTPYGMSGSWESGLIHTRGSFQQTYGYFEMRADLSEVKGAWDAFWLLPTKQINEGKNGGWQELDIVEHYGNNPNGVYRWLHTTDPHADPNADLQVYSDHANQSQGFHTYGMDWNKDTISFYYDGQLIGTKATPSDMHGPMYILANLAMEAGADPSGPAPEMKIDYIRAYAEKPATAPVPVETPINVITGTAARDVLTGTDGRDRLVGLDGPDVLRGGKGADELIGGDGNDTASYATAGSGVTASLIDPTKNTGDAAGDTYSSIERLDGSRFADVLEGDGGDNVINGGAGADRMIGGGGNDTFHVDNPGDVVIEAAKGGWDAVIAYVDYTLTPGQEIEGLHAAGGTVNLTLTGNEFNNYLYGNETANELHGGAGKDVLSGGAGDDRLFGEDGSDKLTGGAGRDTFVFSTALKPGEFDTITDFNPADDTIALAISVFDKAGPAGTLAPSAFYAAPGGVAHAAADRILYDTKSGDLFYDADGSGSGAAVRFAHLEPGLALTSSDFTLFG
ncbi:family 16 glycosylhydrolase [Aureimonas sp. AU40]|uniref:family 16 glycosylhydrolase n=1 Tax=Aureimonas sp. AU40 TaxID=1637747 RepID=UPI000780D4A1|nr:family 16 glycosylhydrolase [Aureimonas sp. AU40]